MFAPGRRKALLFLGSIGMPQFALGDTAESGERDVVIAYVNSLVELAGSASKDLVVASMTTSFVVHHQGIPTLAELRGDIPETTGLTAQEFLRVNASPMKLDMPVEVLAHWTHVRMVDEETLTQLFEQPNPAGGWKQFYSEYPNACALIQFSRVGIDDQARQALFSVSISSGMLRGASYLVLMQNRDGAWRQFRDKMVGIS